jgi:hypothetical protein
MKKIKIGDKVRCVDPGSHSLLKKNGIYICMAVSTDDKCIGIIINGEDKSGYWPHRFELAMPELSNNIRVL